MSRVGDASCDHTASQGRTLGDEASRHLLLSSLRSRNTYTRLGTISGATWITGKARQVLQDAINLNDVVYHANFEVTLHLNKPLPALESSSATSSSTLGIAYQSTRYLLG
jgi:hypothetical protein